MREQTAEVSAPIEQEFLSVIREYERVIYKVCYLYANPNAPLNDLYQDVVLNLWKAYPKFRKECAGNSQPHQRYRLGHRSTRPDQRNVETALSDD